MFDVNRMLTPFRLCHGLGSYSEKRGCINVMIGFLTGHNSDELWSDEIPCVSPVIRAATVRLNDWGDYQDDIERGEFLLPHAHKFAGTNEFCGLDGDGKEIWKVNEQWEQQRAFLFAEAAVRVFAADALDDAGIAHSLRDLAPIVDVETAKAAARAANAVANAAYDAVNNAVAVAAYAATAAANKAASSSAVHAAASAINAAAAAQDAKPDAAPDADAAEDASFDAALAAFSASATPAASAIGAAHAAMDAAADREKFLQVTLRACEIGVRTEPQISCDTGKFAEIFTG